MIKEDVSKIPVFFFEGDEEEEEEKLSLCSLKK